jgi:hypothetical protein
MSKLRKLHYPLRLFRRELWHGCEKQQRRQWCLTNVVPLDVVCTLTARTAMRSLRQCHSAWVASHWRCTGNLVVCIAINSRRWNREGTWFELHRISTVLIDVIMSFLRYMKRIRGWYIKTSQNHFHISNKSFIHILQYVSHETLKSGTERVARNICNFHKIFLGCFPKVSLRDLHLVCVSVHPS